MTNRRAFCRTVAGAAGALVLADPFGTARAQEARRQVTIGGRRVKVIDIHCHCVIPEAAEVVKSTPLAKAGGGGGGNQVLGPQRLALMDKTGVDVQALVEGENEDSDVGDRHHFTSRTSGRELDLPDGIGEPARPMAVGVGQRGYPPPAVEVVGPK